jgi:LemA protein
MMIGLIIGAIILVLLAWVWATYNGLIKAKLRTDEAYSDITVQMKRRFDLIPNIIETVKGYAKQESSVLENVTKARTAAMAVPQTDLAGQAAADNQLSGTLKTLFAVSENYPDLKSNTNFLQLQEELVDTEDKIQASRRFYNGNVRDLNTKIQMFPTNMFAQMLGFSSRDFFDVENKAEVDAPVAVKF